MKKLLLLMTCVICALGLHAQNTKTVTGAVIDKNGNPLPNALVQATGGAESVTTDADGTFNIEVSYWLKSLTAKYAGMQDKKLKLDGNSQLLFEMSPKVSYWFVDVAFAPTLVDGGARFFMGLGLMGGYIADWGYYGKVLMPIGADGYAIPSATVGAIKQISTPVYLYIGGGYSPVFGGGWWYYDGGKVDIGALYRINRYNVGLGYSMAIGGDCLNHTIQLSVGYCF